MTLWTKTGETAIAPPLKSLRTYRFYKVLFGAPFGPPGQEVFTPNLTPGGEPGFWSEDDFFNTMRAGRTPSGRQLNEEMPWRYYGQMTDEELKAVWLCLQSLPKLEQAQ